MTRFKISPSRHLDIIFCILFIIVVFIFLYPILSPGQIIFSDISFGVSSERYLEEMTDIWNQRWSTPTLFNLPRVWFALPFQLLSTLFDDSGIFLLKSIIISIVFISAFNMRLLSASLLQYIQKLTTPHRLLISWFVALFYALNPWVIVRIQHIYLLVGYAFFPLLLFVLWKLYKLDTPPKQIRQYFWLATAIAFSYAMISTSQHYVMYGAITIAVVSAYGLVRWLRTNEKWFSIVRAWSAYLVLIGILTIFLTAYWLVPYISAILTHSLPSQYNININTTIDIFSRYSSLPLTLLGISYWWPMFSAHSLHTYWLIGILFLVISMFAIRFVKQWRALLLTIIVFILVANVQSVYSIQRYSLIGGSVLVISTFAIIFIRKWRMLLPLVFFIAILATGTYYAPFRSFYLTLVFELPTPFGLIFRDPNKLVGILLILLSVSLAFSLAWIFTTYNRATQMFVAFCLFLSWIVWNAPWHSVFIGGFYTPPNLPADYQVAFDMLKEEVQRNDNERVIYLPTPEWMLDTNLGYTTPDWNIINNVDQSILYRATPDFGVFNTPMNTLFQYEGASPAIKMYYDYLQTLLEQGRSDILSEILQSAGVNWIVFQSVYDHQSARQDRMLNTLMSANLEYVYAGSDIQIFRVPDHLHQIQTINHVIYSSDGYNIMDSYLSFDDSLLDDAAIAYTTQEPTPINNNIRSVDYVDISNMTDLVLSNLPKSVYQFPFNWSRASTGWNATTITGLDFKQALSIQKLDGFVGAFDFGGGIIYADQQYYVEPTSRQLPVWLDTSDLQTSFQKNNAYSIAINDSKLEFMGRLESANWEIIESEGIKIDDQKALRLTTSLTADNVQNFHIKVLSYNAQGKQIGVHYIVPSQDSANYESESIESWIPIPINTYWVYVQILTQSEDRAEIAQWSLRDLKIEDATEVARSVAVSTQLAVKPETSYRIFMRVLESPAGGEIRATIDNQSYSVETKASSRLNFVWNQVADITPDSSQLLITVENISGFNAINSLVVVPIDLLENNAAQIGELLKVANTLAFIDAKTEMDYVGRDSVSVNSTNAPNASLPYFADGALTTQVFLPKDGSYTFVVQHRALGSGQQAYLNLKDIQQNIIASTKFTTESTTNNQLLTTTLLVNDVRAGEYNLQLIVDKYPEPQTVRFYPFDSQDSFIHEVSVNAYNILPSQVQNWRIFTSDQIPILGSTYNLTYDLSLVSIRKPHIKIRYYDEFNREIAVDFIGEKCRIPGDISLCSSSRPLITPPSDAKFMRFDILAQSDLQSEGKIEIHKFEVVNLDEYFGIVGILIKSIDPSEENTNAIHKDDTVFWRNAKLELGKTNEKSVVLWRESPSPLWRTTGHQIGVSFPLNGVNQGFSINGGDQIKVYTVLDSFYLLGVVTSLLTIILLIILRSFVI